MNEEDAVTIIQNMLNTVRTTMLYKNSKGITIDTEALMMEEALGIVLEKAKKNVRLEGVALILNNVKKGEENEL